jgi:hypothetical protein
VGLLEKIAEDISPARALCYHRRMTLRPLAALAALLLPALLACSPKYNWRDYASPDAPYRVTFPAKPSNFTRNIELDGMRVAMTMTAAEVDGATFAVGAAQAQDPARAQAALEAMKLALLRNIGASAQQQASASTSGGGENRAALEVDATGQANGAPMRLVGHFEARGTRFYQVIVMGRPKAVPPEQLEQFFTSFKLQ